MFTQTVNQLLDKIQNNQISRLNLSTPSPDNEALDVTPPQVWEGRTHYVSALAVLPDGSVVSGSKENTLRHWDPQSGRCRSVWTGHNAPVTALVVLPDGSLVSASSDNTLRHWDPQSGQCTSVWRGYTSTVGALAALPDGSIVSASSDSSLRHWDTQSGRCIGVWAGHTSNVAALAVLPDGSLVSASLDKTLRHWDTYSGQCTSVWKGHTGWVTALAALADGSIVSASSDSTLRHWDSQSGQCLKAWGGRASSINSLVALPDGFVISGTGINPFGKNKHYSLRRWDPQSGQCLNVWRGHTGGITALAALPDGSTVSASVDNTLRRWWAPPQILTLQQIEGVLDALKDNRSVETFALSGVIFTPTMMQALTQVIAHHPHLSSLSLERCCLIDEGMQPLLNALKNPVSKLTQFNLSHNPQISEETQRALQQAMELRQVQYPVPEWTKSQKADIQALLNNSLQHLEWSETPLTQVQVLGLAGVLTMNHSLRTLSLEDAQVDILGVQSLAQVLKIHPGIQKLLLDDNPLGEQGLQAVLELFQQHNTLFKVAAAVETKSTKPHRQQLKAYNRQYKFRKEQSSVLAAAVDESFLPAHFYDRAWDGNQVMAEPVFSSVLGRLVEKERLVNHGGAVEGPAVALPLVEEHIRETVTETQPHAWHEGTVYLPQLWVLGVLEAIEAGQGNFLTTYWERHPGLVTHHYGAKDGTLPVYRLLINAGRKDAFSHWLEYYSRYQGDDPALPSIATWFSEVAEGHHALHYLIQTMEGEEQEKWFREVRFDLGVTGGVYHGLVHLHRPETLEADKNAIERLVAQKLLPIDIDKEGYTPLMRAMTQGHYDLVELLLPYSEPQARAVKIHHDRYVERLENTISLLLEQMEGDSEAKNKAENVLKASLAGGVPASKTYPATKQRLRQLFFSSAPAAALDSPEEVLQTQPSLQG